MTEKTTRTEVREWVNGHIKGKEEIQISDIAQKVIFHFQKDQKFIQRFLTEHLSAMTKEIVQDIIAQTRSPYVGMGDSVATRDAVKRRAKKHSRFLNWYEHVGDRHVLYMEADKTYLFAAADEREARGLTELTIARLNRHVGGKLTPEQKVKDVFTPEEVDGLYEQFQNERNKLQENAA